MPDPVVANTINIRTLRLKVKPLLKAGASFKLIKLNNFDFKLYIPEDFFRVMGSYCTILSP